MRYWEAKDSLASMRDLRERDPYTFYAQVQQRPTPPGGAMIKTDWIQHYASLPDTLHTLLFVMDTALKTAERNDYSVLSLWGIHRAGRLPVRRAARQMGGSRLVARGYGLSDPASATAALNAQSPRRAD